ncbi:hypothetical protein H0H87_008174 [Tephrocybe sp. NHM501043]|nr:hypothetical protein H0H87_008174 [Tephrocybe sp. NHM501043]
MVSKRLSYEEAFAQIQNVLPLFNPTKSFSRHLELFEACQYNPTLDDPRVQDWAAFETSTTSTPQSGINPDISGIAAEVMSETGFDMNAFGNALAAIQRREISS